MKNEKKQKKRKKYTNKFKETAVAACANRNLGVTVESVAKEFKIAPGLLYKWKSASVKSEKIAVSSNGKKTNSNSNGDNPYINVVPATRSSDVIESLRVDVRMLSDEVFRLQKECDALQRTVVIMAQRPVY